MICSLKALRAPRSIRWFTLPVLILVLSGDSSSLQAQTGTWNGTSGNWTDVTRWNQANFPDVINGIPNAIVNGGNVNLDQNISVDEFQLNGGTLAGSNDLDVSTTFLWTGGTLGGTGTTTASNGGQIHAGGTGVQLDRTLDFWGGVADWNAGDISGTGGFQLSNGNVLFVTGIGGLTQTMSTDLSIDATSAFISQSSLGTNLTGSQLSVSGQLFVTASGVLNISSTNGSGSGALGADAGSTLQFSGGSHSYSGPVSGGGNFRFSGGNVAFTGALGQYNTQTTTLDGGTVGGQMQTQFFDWTAGDLAGTGTLETANGTFHGSSTLMLNQNLALNGGQIDWNSNNVSGSGKLILDSGGLFANNAGSRSFSADMQINASGGLVHQNVDRTTVNGSSFVNDGFAGATSNGTLEISSAIGSGGGQFQVDSGSTIEFSGGSHNYTGFQQGPGTFEFSGGSVSFSGGGYNATQTKVSGGTVGGDMFTQSLDWNGGSISGGGTLTTQNGFIGGSGGLSLAQNLSLDGGSLDWQSNSISGSGTVNVVSGILGVTGTSSRTLSNDLSIDFSGAMQNFSSGTVNIAGSSFLNNGFVEASGNGTLNISATSGSGSGQFQTQNGSTLEFSSGTHNYQGDFNGSGDIAFTGGTATLGGAFISANDLTVGNGAQVVFDNNASTSIAGNNLSNLGQFEIVDTHVDMFSVSTVSNSGLFVIDGATAILSANSYTQTAGETRFIDESGAVIGFADIQGGSFTGNGNLQGSLLVGSSADIAAGNSAGIIDVQGSFQLLGTMEIEVGGNLVDGLVQNMAQINRGTNFQQTDYDQIHVFGNALISNGATLDFSLIGGYLPVLSDFFDVITADSLSVNTTAINIIAPTGFNASTQVVSLNDPGFGVRDALRVSFVAIPEPSAVSGLSLLMLGLMTRRKKAELR